MEKFTGWQYLLIDLANAFGHDKETFEFRIKWAEESIDQLEQLIDKAETKPLYVKAVQAIRKTQAGVPCGHLVGFDATCSGIQMMSVLTGCIDGARSVGLIDPNVRADAYTEVTRLMNEILAAKGLNVTVTRKQAKNALMTAFYGSTLIPKRLFGENTPQLEAFYQAAAKMAPGPFELLGVLLNSWRNGALSHNWQLPDGFEARIKVMKQYEDERVEVDELDHASFSYTYYVNEGKVAGRDEGTKSNAANVVHSVDAYVLRCMHRRCNYDADVVCNAAMFLRSEHLHRLDGNVADPLKADAAVRYYIDLFNRTSMADVVILPHLNQYTVQALSDAHLSKLYVIVESMLQHKPFDLITIHDEFKCHPNYMNFLRHHYIDVMAELADSTVLEDILSNIYGVKGGYAKRSQSLSQLIRQSNYALC